MDIDTIKTIAVGTELFNADDARFVDDVLTGVLDGSLPDHHFVVQEADDGAVIGAAYYAPEPFSDRMRNLCFIAVSPIRQGDGIGGSVRSTLAGRCPRDP